LKGKFFFQYIFILWPYMSLPPHEATWFCEICCKSLEPSADLISSNIGSNNLRHKLTLLFLLKSVPFPSLFIQKSCIHSETMYAPPPPPRTKDSPWRICKQAQRGLWILGKKSDKDGLILPHSPGKTKDGGEGGGGDNAEIKRESKTNRMGIKGPGR
jgi:hypothetical protein